MGAYIGIDPGKKGGLSLIINGKAERAIGMPKDHQKLLRFLVMAKRYNPTVILEKSQAMRGQGVTGVFNYGKGYGELVGTCKTIGLPIVEISPQKWKNEIVGKKKRSKRKLNMKKSKRKKNLKIKSIAICKELFPNIDLQPGRKRIDCDGIAESCLIGYYGEVAKL